MTLEAFSPFIPLNATDSSLPATIMRFSVNNTGATQVEVEIAGWIQNAVCLGSGRAGAGQRRNRILRETGLRDASTLAERVLGRIRSLLVAATNDETLSVTVSIGVAEIEASDDEKSWLDRADRCLYAAKEAGRNRLANSPLASPPA